ncbi:MAG: hypothetical protein ACTSSE_17835 [Candidatus Thorarchaeota archaeon]
MAVAINVVQPILVVIFTVIFLGLLATRGTRKGRTILVIIFLIITVLIAFPIYDALRWYSIPLGPPPEIWSEAYGDSLFMRNYAYNTALVQSIIFLILSISLVCRKWYETK